MEATATIDARAVRFFPHGSTVVINALLSRQGAKTALVTTCGFRNVLEIACGNRPDLFNFAFRKPRPGEWELRGARGGLASRRKQPDGRSASFPWWNV